MQASIPSILLVALCASGTHCGPTPQESGQTVLEVAPLVVLCTMALQWALLRLWKGVRPELLLSWRKNLALVGVLAFPAVWALLVCERPFEWAPMGFWLFGCTYAGIVLLITRVWLFFKETRGIFLWPHVGLCVVMLSPAVVMALFGGSSLQQVAEAMWIFPGFGGWASGPLLLLLLIEVAIRRARKPALVNV